MGNLEKKKLEKSAWSKSRYQARRLAGLCGLGCGSVPESGACCRACREKVKSRAETLRGNFNTCSGCHAYLDTSNRRCSKCLEKKRLYNKKNRSSQFGKWASSIRVATLKVAKGLNSRGCSYLNSKLFEWSHFDFKSKFPLHDFENKELQIDHIIPLGVACCSDGAVDQSIAHMVGGLGNIQIISGKKNSFKGLNNDAKCKKRSTELRLTGYSGDHLWSALVAEFSHEPMDV